MLYAKNVVLLFLNHIKHNPCILLTNTKGKLNCCVTYVLYNMAKNVT